MYSREGRLELSNKVSITKKVDEILKEEKKKQKLSKAKIVCNLVLERYEKEK